MIMIMTVAGKENERETGTEIEATAATVKVHMFVISLGVVS